MPFICFRTDVGFAKEDPTVKLIVAGGGEWNITWFVIIIAALILITLILCAGYFCRRSTPQEDSEEPSEASEKPVSKPQAAPH